MNQIYILGALGLVLIVGGYFALVFSIRWFGTEELSSRLSTYVTTAEAQSRQLTSTTAIRNRELTGSFISRTLLPFFRQAGSFLGRLTPANSIEQLRRQLYIAGYPLGLGPREFFGLRIAFIFFGFFLALLMLRRGINSVNLLLGAAIFFVCLIFPVLWLRMLVGSRQDKLRKGLPDALDMLSVCADAGLGFDQALQRISEHWTTPIGLELGRVVAEMEMGSSRREALRNLADRLDVSEISSFVSVILQSEQLGMSIADTLHAQAEQMRIERRFRAQEVARTLPIKMLIPLAFMIFPAILAVILGPAIPQLADLFGNL
ncbi:MAG TPA: type II secretion system F family protein [Anaerolineales bacterium]